MSNRRGWTWINEENADAFYTEERRFRAQDEDRDYDFDSEEEAEEDRAREEIRYQLRQGHWENLESRLYNLSARLMRPYEHWNEGEAYMAYAERDRG